MSVPLFRPVGPQTFQLFPPLSLFPSSLRVSFPPKNGLAYIHVPISFKKLIADLKKVKMYRRKRQHGRVTNILEISEVPMAIAPCAKFQILYQIIPSYSNVFLFPFVPESPLSEFCIL